MTAKLAAIPRLTTVANRLKRIFPEGLEHRNYCIRDVAARTVWVMFYAGAIEGSNRWIRPSMVTDMSDRQARHLDDASRNAWYARMSSTEKRRPADAWSAPNSREQIRDETLRLGLIPTGAVIERRDLPTTSPLPKYALAAKFAALFDERLRGTALDQTLDRWRRVHLSRAALARIALIRASAVNAEGKVSLRLPNGQSWLLAPGPSSVLTKAVIEDFAPPFLEEPGVLWLSESASKVREYDRRLASAIGLKIDPEKNLPDVVLVDAGKAGGGVLLVFVEVVATDGPITEKRKATLLAIAREGGFSDRNVAFLTAFRDRSHPAFRRCVAELAVGSFIWFMAEPDHLMILRGGKPIPLTRLR